MDALPPSPTKNEEANHQEPWTIGKAGASSGGLKAGRGRHSSRVLQLYFLTCFLI